MKTKCPICGNIVEHNMCCENIGVVEEYIDCNRCGFFYQFCYGLHLEIVGRKYFIWDWTTKIDNPVFKRMKKEEFSAKRRWKKYKKGVTCKSCPI